MEGKCSAACAACRELSLEEITISDHLTMSSCVISSIVVRIDSVKTIQENLILDQTDQALSSIRSGHEDTMMGSHPGGRVTACSVRCSILEYLIEMVPYDISSCPDKLTIGYCFVGLKSLELYPIGELVFFGCWSKAIGSILRTSDRPSRNIDRVISGHLRSGVSQTQTLGSPIKERSRSQLEGTLSSVPETELPSKKWKTSDKENLPYFRIWKSLT
ncbi:hypothetical protein DY000_02046322 [Brassica cretica]|uniref:Uncharacterized protein n=1 Tax=Brassica cretica TaxID=69181 RepID=A0ABQ7ETE7_BRACR|nr:hypothetical protein DY000_02046322 [Brassica cretica]